MKKLILTVSLSLTTTIAVQASDFWDSVALFYLQSHLEKSITDADAFLRSPQGDALVQGFRESVIGSLTKDEIKQIRHVVEHGSLNETNSLLATLLTPGAMQEYLQTLKTDELEQLRGLVLYLQSKLRTPQDWMHKDIVDDTANAAICVIDKEIVNQKFGSNPELRDYLFGVLLSKQTGHYIKAVAKLKLNKWRLAFTQNKR